jgi:hypothetical protein
VSETRKPLTAKIAKKQREERKEKQQSCFATFAVKDFARMTLNCARLGRAL